MGGKSSKAGGGLGKKITTQLTKLFKEIDTDNSKTISKEEAIEFCAYICFVFLKARRRCGSPPGHTRNYSIILTHSFLLFHFLDAFSLSPILSRESARRKLHQG